jgi:GNAT superfamily N-acetyltransferase
MKIRQIDLNLKRDVKKFILFPFDLYKKCKQWVPPLISGEMKKLDPAFHPYYQHSTADFYLLESQRGKTLGRIALLHNSRYNQFRNENSGLFGFFDVIEDTKAANLLLETAEEWGHKKGFNRLVGPKGLITTELGGVLAEGFQHRAAININYNYAYYPEFLENAGYTKERDSLSGYIHIPSGGLPERVRKIAKRVMQKRGYYIRQFETKDDLRAMVGEAQQVLEDSFRDGAGHVEMTDEEFALVAENLITIADPSLIKVVMKDDKIIGYLFAYHDISAGLQRAKGRLFPFGWLHLMIDQKRTKWMNVNGLGVLPEYQGMGGNAILYEALAQTIQSKFKFEHLETIFIGEENYRSFSDNLTLGVEWYKRHRLYQKNI